MGNRDYVHSTIEQIIRENNLGDWVANLTSVDFVKFIMINSMLSDQANRGDFEGLGFDTADDISIERVGSFCIPFIIEDYENRKVAEGLDIEIEKQKFKGQLKVQIGKDEE